MNPLADSEVIRDSLVFVVLKRLKSNLVRPRIYLILRGGLGNQLHQIAASVHLAEKYEGKVIIFSHIVDTAQNPERRGFFRRVDLSGLFPRSKIKEVNRFEELILRFLNRISFQYFQRYVVSEGNFFKSRNKYFLFVDGWFQSHDYLPININFSSLSDKFLESNEEITLHIRLTDFLSIDKEPLDKTYYEKAMKAVSSRLSQSRIRCFSDDIPSAIEMLSSEYTFNFPESEIRLEADKLLVFLASSNALICSKSSLCWWAANAVSSRGGIVVSPWLGPTHKNEWMQIDN